MFRHWRVHISHASSLPLHIVANKHPPTTSKSLLRLLLVTADSVVKTTQRVRHGMASYGENLSGCAGGMADWLGAGSGFTASRVEQCDQHIGVLLRIEQLFDLAPACHAHGSTLLWVAGERFQSVRQGLGLSLGHVEAVFAILHHFSEGWERGAHHRGFDGHGLQ
jgi:hypothetical protein